MRLGRTYEPPCCWRLGLGLTAGLSDNDLVACKILIQISLCVEFRNYLTRGGDVTSSMHSPLVTSVLIGLNVERFFKSCDDP